MFDLEKAVAEWRREMLEAGIKTPEPLEELESHLREDVDDQMRTGLDAQQAFEKAAGQIGKSGVLKSEFAKAGDTVYQRLKRFIYLRAGVPEYQLSTNMNAACQEAEPRRATYFKTIVFLSPAVFLWTCFMVFVLPKLREVCVNTDTSFPRPISTALAMSDFVRMHFFLELMGVAVVVVFLERRSGWWARHRRQVFGVTAFLLNSAVLVLISAMLVMAVVAATKQPPHVIK
jgi:hypothetical protein